MKTKIFHVLILVVFLYLFFMGFFSLLPALYGSLDDRAVLPVRVVHKERPVTGLEKSDFRIYVNGIQRPIIRVEEVKDIMNFQNIETGGSRIFILIFSIFDFNKSFSKAVDNFFERIYEKGDKIIVHIGRRAYELSTERPIMEIRSELIEALKKQSIVLKQNLYQIHEELENAGVMLEGSLASGDWQNSIENYLESYRRKWRDFKSKFLSLDMEFYEKIFEEISSSSYKKVGLCFYQRAQFFRPKKFGPIFSMIYRELDKAYASERERGKVPPVEMEIHKTENLIESTSGFPIDKIRKVFLRSGFRFHSLLVDSHLDFRSRNFWLRYIQYDYHSDHHYLIIYKPLLKGAVREIKVTAKNISGKFSLIYNKGSK